MTPLTCGHCNRAIPLGRLAAELCEPCEVAALETRARIERWYQAYREAGQRTMAKMTWPEPAWTLTDQDRRFLTTLRIQP